MRDSLKSTLGAANPLDFLTTQVTVYGSAARNQVFPTEKERVYTNKDFTGSDKEYIWTLDNLPMGCTWGCNMLFRFSYDEDLL